MKKPRPFTTLGKTLRAARRARRWTQLALAHRLGLSGPGAGAYVSRIETGTDTPNLTTLQKLSWLLKTTPEKLMEGEKYRHEKNCHVGNRWKSCPACLAALEWNKRPQHQNRKTK